MAKPNPYSVPVKPKDRQPPIPLALKKALADRKVSADSEALLIDLIDVWGGTRKLALDLHSEFVHASKGGMTRQRILEMIQRLIVTNTTHQIGSIRSPSDMTDGELEDLAMSYVKRLAQDASPAAKVKE